MVARKLKHQLIQQSKVNISAHTTYIQKENMESDIQQTKVNISPLSAYYGKDIHNLIQLTEVNT